MKPLTAGRPLGLSGRVAGCLLTFGLAACTANDPPISGSRLKALPDLEPQTACTTLNGSSFPASLIALPTRGFQITRATQLAATTESISPNAVTQALPDHCQILGRIDPVDTNAPPILFQLNVPTRWNQKSIQVGGGGLNGTIPRNLAAIGASGSPTSGAHPPDAGSPLQAGYAMFGGDSGHQEAGLQARWALNAEAWENFGHAGLKKTHDAAFAVLQALYGRKPVLSYFMGQSQGGREALEVAQRYPKDYDGVVATAPPDRLYRPRRPQDPAGHDADRRRLDSAGQTARHRRRGLAPV